MTGRYFDDSHVKSDEVNTSISNGIDMTNNEHKTDSEYDQTESDITHYIRSSMERSQKYDSDQLTSTIKQVTTISSNVISEIPIFISHTEHVIRKAVSIGSKGIHIVTNLKNSLYSAKGD